jgi:hypothetical protein
MHQIRAVWGVKGKAGMVRLRQFSNILLGRKFSTSIYKWMGILSYTVIYQHIIFRPYATTWGLLQEQLGTVVPLDFEKTPQSLHIKFTQRLLVLLHDYNMQYKFGFKTQGDGV